jgi:RNA polymerase sigma-70 factor (sigma-E family)
MIGIAANDTAAGGRTKTGYNRAEFIGRLFDENFVGLRRLAFALVGEATAAEEIAQEAFVRLYASWRRLDQIDHAPSYLRRIVVNLCRSRGRRLAIQQRVEPLMTGPSTVEQPDVALQMDLWAALDTLPTRQRACVVLRYLEDLTEPEVGELLGCSTGTVKSQLHKARAKLGPLLREEEEERA